MQLIDSHCHIDVDAFDADRAEVLARCQARGIRQLVVPAIQCSGWARLLSICSQHAGLYPALGLHPLFVDQHQDCDLPQLEAALAESTDVIAVGEIGLDHYLPELDRQRQLELFEAQLSIARSAELPVILHVRKAHEPVLKALKKIRVEGGIAHAFNGSLELAKQYTDLGFKLGFGGSLTYSRATKLRSLAQRLPLASVVLETDAPDMAGEQYQGQRNSPEYLPDYLAVLAELRDENVEEIARISSDNVRSVLALP